MTRATATAIKMIESLPEETQEYLVEKMRALIEEFQEDRKWKKLFGNKKGTLKKMARKAREASEAGEAEEMEFDKL